MRIVIDIGHPGHVHYFKNTIKQLKEEGNQILIIARDRKIIFQLLEQLNLPFINRGRGKDSRLGKLIYMLKANYIILKASLKFKPDLFLSFSSPYASQVAFLLGKKSILINDTEHADKIHTFFTYPFSAQILTPFCYYGDLGSKQIRFKSLVENLYLHKNYFKHDSGVRKLLGVEDDDKFVILRFVSWKAHHDYGQSGLKLETKKKLIEVLSKKYKIFISSEEDGSDEFSKFIINIPPEKMHSVLLEASLFIGESATMASESCILGTKAIYVNSLPLMGYLKLEQDYELLKYFENDEGVLDYVTNLIESNDFEHFAKERSIEMQRDFIDPTKFLVWFLKNYPESVRTLEDNPNFQSKFV